MTQREHALLTPHEISFFQDKNIIQIAAGSEHSAAVDGRYSNKKENHNKVISVRMISLSLVSDSGALYTWGNGEFGQLGVDVVEEFMTTTSETNLNLTIQKSTPQRVKEALLNERVIKVACGSYHTLVLTGEDRHHSYFVFTFLGCFH
jgi:alpha-tubulin suppressor-like RCC1 family protein